MYRMYEGEVYKVTEEGIFDENDWSGYRELTAGRIEFIDVFIGEARKHILFVPTIKDVIVDYENSRDYRRAL